MNTKIMESLRCDAEAKRDEVFAEARAALAPLGWHPAHLRTNRIVSRWLPESVPLVWCLYARRTAIVDVGIELGGAVDSRGWVSPDRIFVRWRFGPTTDAPFPRPPVEPEFSPPAR